MLYVCMYVCMYVYIDYIKTHDSELRGQEEAAIITRNKKYASTE